MLQVARKVTVRSTIGAVALGQVLCTRILVACFTAVIDAELVSHTIRRRRGTFKG